MPTRSFEHKSLFDAPCDEVFAWHERPGAFERLMPPWLPVSLISADSGVKDGSRVTVRAGYGPLSSRWILEHYGYEGGRTFRSRLVRGLLPSFQHAHLFDPAGERHCYMTDRIEYSLPLAGAGQSLFGRSSERRLRRAFTYRHRILASDLKLIRSYPREPLRIGMTGAGGLIGSSLRALLGAAGHHVTSFSRKRGRGNSEAPWDPPSGKISPRPERPLDAFVHLAGESIFGRWSESKKRRIKESRVEGTLRLCKELASWPVPPKVLICASGTGYYGDRGKEILHEESGKGSGFLADVVEGWEAGCAPLREIGCRVVTLRIAPVLSPAGGALGMMLPPFRAGLGGWNGSGTQFMSWIAIDDLLRIFYRSLFDERLAGPVNACAPLAVTNYELSKTLGKLLRRPVLLPVPKAALRLALGEFADEGLLASQRATPLKLSKLGFEFDYPEIGPALEHLLGLVEGSGKVLDAAPGPERARGIS